MSFSPIDEYYVARHEAEVKERLASLTTPVYHIDPNDPICGSPFLRYVLFTHWPELLDAPLAKRELFYNRYFWFLHVVRIWRWRHGFDAGTEQQLFQLIEAAEHDGVEVDPQEIVELEAEVAHRLVGTVGTPAEIHEWASRYNFNDSFEPIRPAIESRKTEFATALLMYWRLEGPGLDDEDEGEPSANQAAIALNRLLRDRLLSGYYPKGSLRYYPIVGEQLSKTQVYLLKKDGVPLELIEPAYPPDATE